MRKSLMAFAVLMGTLALPALAGQEQTAPAADKKEPAPEFPNMTTVYLGFLKKGPAWSADVTPERQKLQEAHMAHLRKLGEAGKVVLGGPLLDDSELRGVLVFKVASAEEAIALEGEDPAVKAGRLILEVHPWLVEKGILP